MSDDYKFTVDQCDVNDKQTLEQYRIKRTQWLQWLCGDAHHAIWSQIMAMIWNDMSFALLNETRNPACWEGGVVALNAMLLNFIDQGYVASQALAIRKLMEKSNPRDASKGVISLRRLVDDLKDNAHLFTRENYVCHDGMPYDYQAVAQSWHAKQIGQNASGTFGGWGDTTGPNAFCSAEIAHRDFDRLSGVSPDNRRREDGISKTVFDNLDHWLTNSGAQEIVTLANKLIAHAADETSRQAAPLERLKMTISKVAAIHRAFIRCAHAISVGLLQGPNYVRVVPVPQYDLLKHLDQAFIHPKACKDLRDFQAKWVNERDGWVKGDIMDDLCCLSSTPSVP